MRLSGRVGGAEESLAANRHCDTNSGYRRVLVCLTALFFG